ncbi:hypothetical protein ONZ43_g4021 [Nemania bipapillata]|uniref:Uncharacterized protein n=1 Tax=Nemania bipapillata TaxID=110536 RepID=A0ACC2ISX1_9PEZI|nr:hypothetical protein ONZ43_g4021 [Nemania bipapillata]
MTKLWAFKALIFFQVTQDFVFSIINSKAPKSLTDSKTISQVDFITGLPSLIVEAELVIFCAFFHYAYSVTMYQLSDEQKRAGEQYQNYGWRLIYKVFDLRDAFALIRLAFRVRQEVEQHARDMEGQDSSSLTELTPGQRLGSTGSSTQDERKSPTTEELREVSAQ